MSKTSKQRLPADQAKQRILDTAHRFLLEGGVSAVKVQAVARELGITDAAIHYHFKDREQLLEALLAYGGRQLKDAVSIETDLDLAVLANRLSHIYGEQRFARLAMWLSLADWRSDDTGMFSDLADGWQQSMGLTKLEARHRVAFLNLVLAAEPLLAGAFLRSVDLPDTEASRRRFHKWLLAKLLASVCT